MSVLEALKNNGFETIDYVVFVAYIVLLVGLGMFLSRSKKGEEKSSTDYFLAGNTLTWWAVGASLIAANISAEQFIGMSGSAFASGIAQAAYELMAAATLIVVGKFLLPLMIEKKIFTIPQFLRERYNWGVGLAFSLLWLFLYVFVNLTSVSWLGALAIQQILGLPTDMIINVGVSGPGVVKHALEGVHGESFEVLCETIKKTAFKVTRMGQLVAQEASKRLGVPFGIVDLSLAPTPAVGDSVAEILEEMGLESVGAPGTTAALALLNDQVKKGGVMASSYVGGLSGAFIPVSEDQGMIDAVRAGKLTLEKLEAMTCVCSVGLDMIAVPGDTPASTISGIIADEAAIGMINQKTTAVRIIPAIGCQIGDTVEFGGLLGSAPVQPVNTCDCSEFINRKGRIPAPIHSFKN